MSSRPTAGYLSSIEAGIAAVLEDPYRGDQRDEIRAGYWSVRIARHVAFYTFTDYEVRIRRILHQVMDAWKHL